MAAGDPRRGCPAPACAPRVPGGTVGDAHGGGEIPRGFLWAPLLTVPVASESSPPPVLSPCRLQKLMIRLAGRIAGAGRRSCCSPECGLVEATPRGRPPDSQGTLEASPHFEFVHPIAADWSAGAPAAPSSTCCVAHPPPPQIFRMLWPLPERKEHLRGDRPSGPAERRGEGRLDHLVLSRTSVEIGPWFLLRCPGLRHENSGVIRRGQGRRKAARDAG